MLANFFDDGDKQEKPPVTGGPESNASEDTHAASDDLANLNAFPTLVMDEPPEASGPVVVKQVLPPTMSKDDAMKIIESHHPHIAKAIGMMWGANECSMYINKLIVSGGDGMGHTRIGFNPDVVSALMVLIERHDKEFGVLDPGPGFAVHTGFQNLDRLR